MFKLRQAQHERKRLILLKLFALNLSKCEVFRDTHICLNALVMRKPLLILTVVALLIWVNVAYFLVKTESSIPQDETTSIAKDNPVASTSLKELPSQATNFTPEENLVGDSRYDDEQVSTASEWLNSPEAEQRKIGTEQLSAYPTPESEQLLANTLSSDFDPEVRRTAAQGLAAFREPSEGTSSSLLAALQDDDENVQLSAFNTLLVYMNRFEYNSTRMKSLITSLKNSASSHNTKATTKMAIRTFLSDQARPNR